jgi:hypothetical protein
VVQYAYYCACHEWTSDVFLPLPDVHKGDKVLEWEYSMENPLNNPVVLLGYEDHIKARGYYALPDPLKRLKEVHL